MNEEELKEYLKKHLKVKISQSYMGRTEVQLLLDDEVISEDTTSRYGSGKCGTM
jgi:hypothetical protein